MGRKKKDPALIKGMVEYDPNYTYNRIGDGYTLDELTVMYRDHQLGMPDEFQITIVSELALCNKRDAGKLIGLMRKRLGGLTA